jgi:hypothetical protein
MEKDELRLMCIKLALEYELDNIHNIPQLIDKAQEIYKWIMEEREN